MAETRPTPQRGIRLDGGSVPGHRVRRVGDAPLTNAEAASRGVATLGLRSGTRVMVTGPIRYEIPGRGMDVWTEDSTWRYADRSHVSGYVCGMCGDGMPGFYHILKRRTHQGVGDSDLKLCETCLSNQGFGETAAGEMTNLRRLALEQEAANAAISNLDSLENMDDDGPEDLSTRTYIRDQVFTTIGDFNVRTSPPTSPAATDRFTRWSYAERWRDDGTLTCAGCEEQEVHAHRLIAIQDIDAGTVVSHDGVIVSIDLCDQCMFSRCDGRTRPPAVAAMDEMTTYTRGQIFTSGGAFDVRSSAPGGSPGRTVAYTRWTYAQVWGNDAAAITCSSCGGGQDLAHRLLVPASPLPLMYIDLCELCMGTRCTDSGIRQADDEDVDEPVGNHIGDVAVGDIATMVGDDGARTRQVVTGINPTTWGDIIDDDAVAAAVAAASARHSDVITGVCYTCDETLPLPHFTTGEHGIRRGICGPCHQELTNGDELPSNVPPRAEIVAEGEYRCERCNTLGRPEVLRLITVDGADTRTDSHLCLPCVAVMLESMLPETSDEVDRSPAEAFNRRFNESPSNQDMQDWMNNLQLMMTQLPETIAHRLQRDDNPLPAPPTPDTRVTTLCHCCESLVQINPRHEGIGIRAIILTEIASAPTLCRDCYEDSYRQRWLSAPPTENADMGCSWCTHDHVGSEETLNIPFGETLTLCRTCYVAAATETHHCNNCDKSVKVSGNRDSRNASGQALRQCMECHLVLITEERFNHRTGTANFSGGGLLTPEAMAEVRALDPRPQRIGQMTVIEPTEDDMQFLGDGAVESPSGAPPLTDDAAGQPCWYCHRGITAAGRLISQPSAPPLYAHAYCGAQRVDPTTPTPGPLVGCHYCSETMDGDGHVLMMSNGRRVQICGSCRERMCDAHEHAADPLTHPGAVECRLCELMTSEVPVSLMLVDGTHRVCSTCCEEHHRTGDDDTDRI